MGQLGYKLSVVFVALALMAVGMRASAQNDGHDLQALKAWRAGTVVSAEAVKAYGEQRCFLQEAIPAAVFTRMDGRSFPKGCTVNRSVLSLPVVRLL